jgi:hypothetical protein
MTHFMFAAPHVPSATFPVMPRNWQNHHFGSTPSAGSLLAPPQNVKAIRCEHTDKDQRDDEDQVQQPGAHPPSLKNKAPTLDPQHESCQEPGNSCEKYADLKDNQKRFRLLRAAYLLHAVKQDGNHKKQQQPPDSSFKSYIEYFIHVAGF